MADKETMESGSWSPLLELARPFEGLFEELFPARRAGLPAMKSWMPRVDVQETEEAYILSAALPGVRKEDVKIEIKDDVLSISGERRTENEEKGRTWLRRETSYGSFLRQLTLPEGVHPEDVTATHKDGVLAVTIRKPREHKARGVSVKVD